MHGVGGRWAQLIVVRWCARGSAEDEARTGGDSAEVPSEASGSVTYLGLQLSASSLSPVQKTLMKQEAILRRQKQLAAVPSLRSQTLESKQRVLTNIKTPAVEMS